MSNFDGILDPDAGWPDIPQASTSMVVLGGTGGPLNEQATQLTARTKKLRAEQCGYGGQYKNLKVNILGIGYQGTITCDRIVVEGIDNTPRLLRSVSLSFDGSVSGLGGLDTGAIVAGNWYRIFIVYNPATSSVSSLISLNVSIPDLPDGYTHFTKVGTGFVASATTKFKRSRKIGNRVDLLQDPSNTTSFDNVLLNGVTSSVITPFSCAVCAPPEATHLIGISNPSLNGYMYIIPEPNLYDCWRTLAATGAAGLDTQMTHPLVTPQTLYYLAGNNSSFRGVGYIEE